MSTNEGSRPLVGLWHQTLECFSAYKSSWPLMSLYECSVGLISAQVLDSKMNKMSSFKMTTPYCFANIKVDISPNNKKGIS